MVIDVIWQARAPFDAGGNTYPAGDYKGSVVTSKLDENTVRIAQQQCLLDLPAGGAFDCTPLVENHAIIRKPL